MRVRFAFPVIVAVCCGLPAAAGEPDPADKAVADAHFSRGRELFAEKRYGEAAREFETAYRIAPHPAVLVNIALSYEESGDFVQAASWYERYLAAPFDKLDNDMIRSRHAELLALLGRLDIACDAEDCVVRVGGVERGPAPLTVLVAAGSHRVEAMIGGRVALAETREVRSGETVSVRLAIAPQQPPPPAGPEPLEDGDPGGDDAGKPARGAGPPLGAGFWISSGIALAGGVGTAVFGVRTLNKAEEFKDSGYTDAEAKETGERDKLITNIFAGVTAAAAVAAVAFAVIGSVAKSERVEDGEDGPAISLAPGPGLGIGLAASF